MEKINTDSDWVVFSQQRKIIFIFFFVIKVSVQEQKIIPSYISFEFWTMFCSRYNFKEDKLVAWMLTEQKFNLIQQNRVFKEHGIHIECRFPTTNNDFYFFVIKMSVQEQKMILSDISFQNWTMFCSRYCFKEHGLKKRNKF